MPDGVGAALLLGHDRVCEQALSTYTDVLDTTGGNRIGVARNHRGAGYPMSLETLRGQRLVRLERGSARLRLPSSKMSTGSETA
jgi:hypothetical protein